jgi:ATP-dependent Clp protease adaptor protein ClpS
LLPEIEREIERDEEVEELLEPPYRVFVHNDDVTPYDFVITVLQRFFDLDTFQAEAITLTAHTEGVAYVATFPRTEALQRVGKAHFAASLEGYPLTFSTEPE